MLRLLFWPVVGIKKCQQNTDILTYESFFKLMWHTCLQTYFANRYVATLVFILRLCLCPPDERDSNLVLVSTLLWSCPSPGG